MLANKNDPKWILEWGSDHQYHTVSWKTPAVIYPPAHKHQTVFVANCKGSTIWIEKADTQFIMSKLYIAQKGKHLKQIILNSEDWFIFYNSEKSSWRLYHLLRQGRNISKTPYNYFLNLQFSNF